MIDTPHGPARAEVHPARDEARAALMLGHGAGGGIKARDLQIGAGRGGAFRGDAHSATIAVGHVVFHVGIFPNPQTKVDATPENRQFLIPIWPTPDAAVSWPPPAAFSGEDLYVLADSFLSEAAHKPRKGG